MAPFYLTEHGSTLSLDDRRLIVRLKDEDIASAPLAHIDTIVVMANATITTPTLKALLREGVDIVYLTSHGDYCGRMIGPLTGYGELRRLHYSACSDPNRTLQIARACVQGKLRNMRALLMRYNRDLNSQEVSQACERIAAALLTIDSAIDRATLMGQEGAASAAYFGAFGHLFKRDWAFDGRNRRPPTDPVNVLLSFGYTLLAKQMEAAINLVGLDPYLGFLHEVSYGRPSLALDLMEEFRAIVADSVALRCLNNNLILPEDFSNDPDPLAERPVILSKAGSKRFIGEFELRLATEIVHPDTGERATYRRVFELQVRRLATAIKEGRDYAPFLVR